MDIGQWVKACRVKAGKTQTELGDALHVTKGNVSAWETNKHEPSYAQMVEIARLAKFAVPLPGMEAPGWPFSEVSPNDYYTLLTDQERARIEERAIALIEERAGKRGAQAG